MNREFVNKKTKKRVTYSGPVQYITDKGLYDPEFSFGVYFPEQTWCVQLYDSEKDVFFITPLIEFINAYEPVTKPTEDTLQVLNKIFDTEDENYKENICTLHSRSTNTDSGTNKEVLENSKQMD